MTVPRLLPLLLVGLILVACQTDEPPTRTNTLAPTTTVEATQPPARTPAPQSVLVTNVVDGDTIDVRIEGIEQRIRLILVDTPEVFGGEECFGSEAAEFVKELLPPGVKVTLERDISETDRFGRLLRYVYLDDGRMVNELLIEGGYGRVATLPPDVRYVERFVELQREARDAGRGLWSECIERPRLLVVP